MVLRSRIAVMCLWVTSLAGGCDRKPVPPAVASPKASVLDQHLRNVIKGVAADGEDRYRQQRAFRRGEHNFEGAEENWQKEKREPPKEHEMR